MQYPIIDNLAQAYFTNGWTGLNLWPPGGGVNKLNLSACYPRSDAFGLKTTINNDGSVSITGTVTNVGTARLQWRFVGLPTGFDATGLTFIGFNLPSGKTINFRYDSTQNSIVIDVTRLTQGESVNWKIYLLAYSGETAPTSWTPYSSIYPISLLKLPLPHYFPHPVIDALQRAAAGTQTTDDTEILRHYLTPLGIGGI